MGLEAAIHTSAVPQPGWLSLCSIIFLHLQEAHKQLSYTSHQQAILQGDQQNCGWWHPQVPTALPPPLGALSPTPVKTNMFAARIFCIMRCDHYTISPEQLLL